MNQDVPAWRKAVAQTLVNGGNFHSLLGFDILAWEEGQARLGLTLRPEHGNGGGSAHGGVLMSLLDTASGLSGIYGNEGEELRGCVTVSLAVKFLKPAVSGRLLAQARRQGGGKSIFFTYAEILDQSGVLIATADGTFRYAAPAGDFAAGRKGG